VEPPPTDPATLQQVKVAFGTWLQQAAAAVVDPGSATRVATQVPRGTTAAANDIGGYSIIEAPSLEAAVRLLERHPFVARGGDAAGQ